MNNLKIERKRNLKMESEDLDIFADDADDTLAEHWYSSEDWCDVSFSCGSLAEAHHYYRAFCLDPLIGFVALDEEHYGIQLEVALETWETVQHLVDLERSFVLNC